LTKKFVLLLLVLWVSASSALAAGVLNIDIYGPGQSRVNLFVADPLSKDAVGPLGAIPGNAPMDLQQRINANCAFLPFFNMLSARDIVGGPNPGGYVGQSIDFKKFQLSRTDVLVTAAWTPRPGGVGEVELRAYEVYTGRLIVGKGYNVATNQQIPEVAARFCADLMEALTGQGDFFRSNIAFVKKEGQRKQIYMCTAQGLNLQKISNLDGISVSPAWSHDGQRLAFVFLDKRAHNLCIWDRQTRGLQKMRLPGNTLIAPAFTNSGNLAISLDMRGNPEIYELKSDFSVGRALEENWGIDIGPDFDRSGQKMVFVSNRLGNPHVFLKNLATGEVKRLSMTGKYNTGPSISPDGSQVVYAQMMNGIHKLVLVDLATGRERQLTFGAGSDEDPTWSPDGYFIAFSSNRSGPKQIYLTTKHGDEPILIPTGPGEASSPAWGKL
jgi:TolB protein